MTDEGPFYPPVDIPRLKDLTAVGGAGKKPDGQIMYLFGRILDSKGSQSKRQRSKSGTQTAAVATSITALQNRTDSIQTLATSAR
jgi:hypothetical protein